MVRLFTGLILALGVVGCTSVPTGIPTGNTVTPIGAEQEVAAQANNPTVEAGGLPSIPVSTQPVPTGGNVTPVADMGTLESPDTVLVTVFDRNYYLDLSPGWQPDAGLIQLSPIGEIVLRFGTTTDPVSGDPLQAVQMAAGASAIVQEHDMDGQPVYSAEQAERRSYYRIVGDRLVMVHAHTSTPTLIADHEQEILAMVASIRPAG